VVHAVAFGHRAACVRTVSLIRWNTLVSPLATRVRTSRSRSESWVSGAQSVWRASSVRATFASRGDSPAAAARTPRTSSAGSASLSR
jgi:hypothetical protein